MALYHLVNTLTNDAGDALVGYYVRLRNRTSSLVAPLYADRDGTVAIDTVSGAVNAAKTDSTGLYSMYVEDGSYDIQIYDKNDINTLLRIIEDVPMFGGATAAIAADAAAIAVEAIASAEEAALSAQIAAAVAASVTSYDQLPFLETPIEGVHPLVPYVAADSDVVSLVGQVSDGTGSFDVTILVDDVAEHGPVTIDGTLTNDAITVSAPAGSKVEIEVSNLTGTVNTAFVQLTRRPTAPGTIPGMSGPFIDSEFTGTDNKLLLGTGTGFEEIGLDSGSLEVAGGNLKTKGGGGTFGYFARSGDVIQSFQNCTTLVSWNDSPNVLRLWPLPVPGKDITLSALGVYVSKLFAGTGVYVGIYADNDGRPDGGALVCSSGALATTATGAVSGAVSATLVAGQLYWLATQRSSSSFDLRSGTPAQCLPVALAALSDMGSSPYVFNTRYVNLTYGALPSTCPSGTTVASANVAAVGLVVA